MPVLVVDVGHVGVAVPQGGVPVPMAVGPNRHHVVGVRVVAIVVGVGVLMFQRRMFVLVLMRFGQVQHHSPHHQRTACQHEGADGAIPHRPRPHNADERRKGKNRSGAPGTKGPLGQQVKAQA